MRRREFIVALAGAAAGPTAARAQVSTKRPLVAVLSGFARKANDLQQSWRFDWEPPKAVLRDVWTIDWILGC